MKMKKVDNKKNVVLQHVSKQLVCVAWKNKKNLIQILFKFLIEKNFFIKKTFLIFKRKIFFFVLI